MILVLGATGTTGGEVARQLIAAGERPRLLVRSPDEARAPGVRHVVKLSVISADRPATTFARWRAAAFV